MQTWQLFIIPRHPVNSLVTIFTFLTKLTNDLFFLPIEALQLRRSSQAEWNKIQCVNFINPVFLFFTTKGSLVNKTDLQASYPIGTYFHKTCTRPPSCGTPQQLPKHLLNGANFKYLGKF